jgi:hypothetical protein
MKVNMFFCPNGSKKSRPTCNVPRAPGLRRSPWGSVAALAALALLLLPHAAGAQGNPAAPARPTLPRELQPLLSADTAAWLQALADLRANPQARALLLQGLAAQPNSERRWRLAFHLAEFGTAEDLPLLVEAAAGARDAQERRAAVGALQALYPTPPPTDLSAVPREFGFIRSSPPQPFQPGDAGQFMLTESDIQALFAARLPVRLVERIQPLRGRMHGSRRALAEALQARMNPREWRSYGESILAATDPLPPRTAQDGSLRYRVENPLPRPLLLEVELRVWNGRVEPAPPPGQFYLRPGESALVDLPVRIVSAHDPAPVRISLRVREVNAPATVFLQRLLVPAQ